ncbi:hypothetical protein ACFL1M_03505 [Patescibacteria group bacterium]
MTDFAPEANELLGSPPKDAFVGMICKLSSNNQIGIASFYGGKFLTEDERGMVESNIEAADDPKTSIDYDAPDPGRKLRASVARLTLSEYIQELKGRILGRKDPAAEDESEKRGGRAINLLPRHEVERRRKALSHTGVWLTVQDSITPSEHVLFEVLGNIRGGDAAQKYYTVDDANNDRNTRHPTFDKNNAGNVVLVNFPVVDSVFKGEAENPKDMFASVSNNLKYLFTQEGVQVSVSFRGLNYYVGGFASTESFYIANAAGDLLEGDKIHDFFRIFNKMMSLESKNV